MSSYLLIAQSLVRQFEDGDYLLEISQWTKEDGLPSWHIYDFIEDKRGYIWMGSNTGLIRFDGRNFVTFSGKDQGIPNRNIGRIAEDVNGKIWLLFNKEGNTKFISVFDPIKEKAIPIESYLYDSIALSTLSHHGFFKQKDTIWILDPITGKGGRYTGEWEWLLNDTTVDSHDFTNFNAYYPRADGLFWVWDKGEDYATIRLIDKSGQAVPYASFQREGKNFSLIDQNFNFYYWQQSKNIFSLDTLFRFDKDSIKAFPFGEYPKISWGNMMRQDYYSFLKTNQRNIGLNVDQHAVFFFDNKEILFKNLATLLAKEFTAKIYESVFLDKNGAFWFASPTGLFRMSIKKKTFTIYTPQDNTIISVRGMISTTDNQLIANTYSGTFQIDLENQSFSLLPIKDRSVNLSLFKERNTLWIGRYFDDLIQYDLQTQHYQKIPFQFYRNDYNGYDFCRLNDSILWLGSDAGVLQLNENTQVFNNYCLPDTAVYNWYVNQQGIWAGTKVGLIKFNRQGQIEERFPIVENNQKWFKIFYIHEDKDGLFWLATPQGLFRWNPGTKEYRQYTTADGLSDNTIHAVFEDNYDNLWLPSDYGLMRFRKRDGYVTTYFEKDGLPNSEFNFSSHYQRSDNLLFLGGVNGIVSFYPDSLGQPVRVMPSLQLDKVIVYNRETENAVNLTKEAIEHGIIMLQPSENRLEIELVPHYLLETKMVYEWRFPNENEYWITLTDPYLQLNNLRYGSYLLEFRAYPIGDKGTPHTTILSLQLKVVKPFYLQWWFGMLIVLAIFLSVYTYVKWRQRQLLLQNQALQAEVNNQTKELQEKLATIDQQAKELKMIDQAKSRFFINVSHELRTPLTLILGPVANLIEQSLNKNQKAQLQRIKRNARQLRQLTEEILDLARLEVGKLELNEEIIRFNSFVKRIFSAYTSLANYRGILYELAFDAPKGLRIQVDVQKTERILNNLIANALKFTSAGDRVLVKVNVLAEKISFVIQDTGIGINPEDLPRIFDRYYQARHHNSIDNGGLGIGLAMSKELAELLGGQLWAESVLDEGTSLFFDLPIKIQSQETKKITELLTIKPHLQPPLAVTLSPLAADIKNQPSLLLVEDNEDLLDYLTGLLNSSFHIIQANNGLEALAKLNDNPIDLVISDVMMPQMDGFELLKQVRSEPQNWGIPFILLTARSGQQDQLYGLRLGVDAYLSKPFEQKELFARIYNLLENQKKRKEAIANVNIEQSKVEDNNGTQNISFDSQWLLEVESHLRKRLTHSNLKVIDLAEEMSMSERSFRTKLKYCTGLKPNQYILEARLELAYQLLKEKHYPTVSEVIYAVGIQSKAYFSKVFKEKYGKSPSELLR